MNRIDPFNYEKDGIAITFHDTDNDTYTFEVVQTDKLTAEGINAEELTLKLNNAVNRKEVIEEKIFACVKALFWMIENNDLEPLTGRKHAREAYTTFKQLFEVDPTFETTDLSDPIQGSSIFETRVTNLDYLSPKKRTARTKQESMVQAIYACFEAAEAIKQKT